MGRWIAFAIAAICLILLVVPAQASRWDDLRATVYAESTARSQALPSDDEIAARATARHAPFQTRVAAQHTAVARSFATKQAGYRASFQDYLATVEASAPAPRTTATIRAQVQARWQATPTPVAAPVSVGETQDIAEWRVSIHNVVWNVYDKLVQAGVDTGDYRPQAGRTWVYTRLKLVNLRVPTADRPHVPPRSIAGFLATVDVFGPSNVIRGGGWCGYALTRAASLDRDKLRQVLGPPLGRSSGLEPGDVTSDGYCWSVREDEAEHLTLLITSARDASRYYFALP